MKNNSTPHKDKLIALLENDKLPLTDLPRVKAALKYYDKWIKLLNRVISQRLNLAKTLARLVKLLNIYKFYIDVQLIFDSPNDFLYRQKGQLKLDNTIIEEFLPYLINRSTIPEINNLDIAIGSINSFSSVYFESTLDIPTVGGGLRIRTKNQDFAMSKKLYIKTSYFADFAEEITTETNLAYIAAECKTNLDKTMFQEGCATAHDLKSAMPGAKYFLLCEWLDMTPISTAPTDIEQVIILRKAKRISSNKRQNFSTFEGRKMNRDFFINYLKNNPFKVEMFERFVNNILSMLNQENQNEENVLKLGYF